MMEQTNKLAPKTYEEQIELSCEFCRCHESGDTLYELSDGYDGWKGIEFNCIRNIKYCPLCGRELLNDE